MAYNPLRNSYNKRSPRLNKEDYAAKKKAEKDEMFEDVEASLSDIKADDGVFMYYLDTQARFDRYSAINALLISRQFEGATQLKEFNEWVEMGVKVKKGEKAISILEPVPYTDSNGVEKVGYNVKKLFDISQTSAEPSPAPPLANDTKAFVVAIVNSSPIKKVKVEQLPNNINDSTAYFDDKQNVLYIKKNEAPTRLFQDVARELALSEIAYHSDTYTRSENIQAAICTAYMLCKKYGIDTKGIDLGGMPSEWKGLESKDLRLQLTMARDSLNTVSNRVYTEINKERERATPEHTRS